MSLPFSSFWFDKSTGLMAGGDMSGKPTFAEQLEELFGPAAAVDVDGLSELFEELELWLEDDDSETEVGS